MTTVIPSGPAKRPNSRLSNLVYEGGRSQDYQSTPAKPSRFSRIVERVVKRDNGKKSEGSKK